MTTATFTSSPSAMPVRARFRDVVMPKEHGSWSLAFEPLTLGLLVAPSWPGAALAGAVLAGFFARRPLKLVWREPAGARRDAAIVALAGCAMVAATCFALALVNGGDASWVAWLAPFTVMGAVFLRFDLQNGGREELAEIAGAAAFACVVAPLAMLGGESPMAAVTLLVAMIGRAVPSVMYVRACVRGGKTGVYRATPALVAAAVALLAATALAVFAHAPVVMPIALAVLLGRAARRLLWPTPIRARTLGFQELAIGLGFIAAVAAAWNF